MCDDYFNDDAANAICREMGRPYGISSWKNGYFFSHQTSKSVKLDDVKCQSDVWASCTYKTYHNCAHNEDVHISCQGIFCNATLSIIVIMRLIVQAKHKILPWKLRKFCYASNLNYD